MRFRKTRQQKKEKCREGIRAILTIPQAAEHNIGTKVAATYAFGLVGLAVTSGKKDRKVIGKIRLAPRGVVFTSGVTGDLRIPYEDIHHCEKGGGLIYTPPGIVLANGEKILISVYKKEFFDFVNEKACGQIEAGW